MSAFTPTLFVPANDWRRPGSDRRARIVRNSPGDRRCGADLPVSNAKGLYEPVALLQGLQVDCARQVVVIDLEDHVVNLLQRHTRRNTVAAEHAAGPTQHLTHGLSGKRTRRDPPRAHPNA